MVQSDELAHLLGRLVHELEAQEADADSDQGVEVFGRRLGLGVEDGVSATHVGQHPMILAVLVAEVEGTFLARVPAVLVIVAIGQEAAEDTMLRVENGQMLMGDHLEAGGPLRAQGMGEVADLRDVEVVRGRYAREAPDAEEEPGRHSVRGVEAKVANELGQVFCACTRLLGGAHRQELVKSAGAPHQDRISIQPLVELRQLVLHRLQHAR
mmetsp:Transcript_34413/g.97597  ORF Transcript_34413/g.97597 Transcript_34413/m.97597 type:complete len:211 (-) Transcript_34413:2093-2725(-)